MTGKHLALLGGPFGAGPAGDPNWQNVSLLSATGTTNAAQNNTFLDSSSNNFTITRNGNTTQGTFTPFSQADGYWGNYFDGTGDVIYATETSSQFTYGTGDYTYECWIYPTSDASTQRTIFGRTNTGNVAVPYIYLVTTTGVVSVYYSSTIVSGTTAIPSNTWTHIMVSRLSGTTRIFVNGVQEGSASDSTNLTSPTAVMIGGSGTASANPFTGYISNARILKGTGYSSITVPTTPLTAITNTQLLTCQSNRFVDNSSNAFALTIGGNPTVVPFQPFGAPTSPYSTTNVGGSGYFDGTGDYLTVGASADWQFTGDHTVECWVWSDSFQTDGRVAYATGGSGSKDQLFFSLDGSVLWALISTTGKVNTKSWNHIVATRSGSTVRIFINGVLQGTGTDSGTIGQNSTAYIGQRSGLETPWNGYIGSLRIIKGSIPTSYQTSSTTIGASIFTPPTSPLTTTSQGATSGDVKLLLNFTNAGIYDNAAKNDMETVGNAQVSTSVYKYGTSSIAFDGTGDDIRVIDNAGNVTALGTSEFTIEFWLNATSWSTYNNIYDARKATDSQILIHYTSGALYFYYNGSNRITGPSLSTGVWYHIALNRSGSNTKLYVNGTQVGSTYADTNNYAAQTVLTLGARNDDVGNPFTGYMSEVRVTKGLGRYPYNFTPPAAALPTFYQAQTLTADPYFEYTTLLLPGNGTNGAQNNTFLDSSTNAFSITRNGNTTQGTFSPFSLSDGTWSNYFDGTANGSLRADSTTDTNLSGDFTVQAWVFPTANGQSSNSEIISRGAASTLNGWHLGLPSGGSTVFFQVNYSGLGNSSTSIQTSTSIPLNQWTHIAVTRSGNTAKIYLNGQLDTTNTGFTTAPTVSGTEYVYVGRASYDTSNRQFTGYVSNASIIKGTALTTFNTTTPLATGTSGQSLLTCTSNRFIDTNTATTAKTLTVGTGASVQAFSPFNPTAAWSAATNGGSGYFDGTGDYLTTANVVALSGDFTVECWVYYTTLNNASIISSINQNGYGNWDFYYNNTANTLRIVGTGSASYIESSTLPFTPTVNSWVHFAASRSGSTVYWWANGQAAGTTTNSTNWTGSNTTTYIGQSNDGSFPISGYLAGLRVITGSGSAIYTSAFTPPTSPPTNVTGTWLLLNYTNAGIYDATAKNDLETVGNAQISTTQSKFGGSSMYFDGTGDWLVSPTNTLYDLNGDFTIEFWIYLNSLSGNPTPIDRAYTGSALDSNGYLIQYSSSALKFYGGGSSITSSQTDSTSTWYYYAIVRYGSTITMYRNGANVGSATISTAFTYSRELSIGGNSKAGAGFSAGQGAINGYMQDVRITKGIARYTQNFTPPTAAFLLL